MNRILPVLFFITFLFFFSCNEKKAPAEKSEVEIRSMGDSSVTIIWPDS